MKKLSLLSLSALTLSVALVGCGGGGGGGGTTASNGSLSVAMTDAPACGYNNVYVTVDRVRVHQSANAASTDAGWSEVVLNSPKRVDLLSLTNGVLSTLGQTPLPAGRYQQIRLLLVPNSTSSPLSNAITPTGGTEQALSTPSATQSGYKVVGSFDVQANTLTDLVIDFDACHSIVKRGGNGYALKPVVKATPVVVSGSITGFVDLSEAGATVLAEQNGVIVKGTVADSTGKFVLSPIVQSTTNGNYDVVITQSARATGLIRAVPVLASANTVISTSAMPFVLPISPTHIISGTATPAADTIVLDALQQPSSGLAYLVSSLNADLTNGSYSFTLPTAPPLIGMFGSLPIVLTANTSAAGQYVIRATNSTTNATQSSASTNISSADATGVNFAL